MNELIEPFERLLAGAGAPAVVRSVEAGGPATDLWNAIESAGFLDALVPEACGGFGLTLQQVFGLVAATGRHATPVPVGHTMFARASLANAGAEVPRGPIAIAPCAWEVGGGLLCRHVPDAQVAQWFIVPLRERWLLMPRHAAKFTHSGIHSSLHGDVEWDSPRSAAFVAPAPLAWLDIGAVVAAARITGAVERLLEMTVRFANERVQFGRPLGKFQVIQHKLAIMAENVAATRMAATLGFDSATGWPQPLRAAVAKARASEAASLIALTSHAVHGAIGMTQELDLQLFTRRLHEWRADFGPEGAWNVVLGRALIQSGADTLNFMCSEIFPS